MAAGIRSFDILVYYFLGADRRGAGNLNGNSGPPGPNFHPNFLGGPGRFFPVGFVLVVFSGVFFSPGVFVHLFLFSSLPARYAWWRFLETGAAATSGDT